MKTFEAHCFNDKEIILKQTKEIQEMMNLINDNEDFVLSWIEGDDLKSKLMIATNLSAKIKTEDIKIYAKEEKGGKTK